MVAVTMTEKQRELVVQHLYVADNFIRFNYTVNPFVVGLTREDLRQTGYLALCKAATVYNGSVKFETFAQKVLKSSLADYFRSLNCTIDLSLDAQLNDDYEDCKISGALSDATAQNGFMEVETKDLISRCKKKYSGITQKGIEAIELKMQGFTGPEIAKLYGCKSNEITAWIAKARQQLRYDSTFLSAIN